MVRFRVREKVSLRKTGEPVIIITRKSGRHRIVTKGNNQKILVTDSQLKKRKKKK